MNKHDKLLRRVEVIEGKINFTCLRADCPRPCCGPFGGVQKGIECIEGLAFSEIILTTDDIMRIRRHGSANFIKRIEDGRYKMRTHIDGSCTAFINGLCDVHHAKPSVCRAFPFYIDMFVGLCGVTTCPGFGEGWTKIKNLVEEISATKKMYEFWLNRIEER